MNAPGTRRWSLVRPADGAKTFPRHPNPFRRETCGAPQQAVRGNSSRVRFRWTKFFVSVNVEREDESRASRYRTPAYPTHVLCVSTALNSSLNLHTPHALRNVIIGLIGLHRPSRSAGYQANSPKDQTTVSRTVYQTSKNVTVHTNQSRSPRGWHIWGLPWCAHSSPSKGEVR